MGAGVGTVVGGMIGGIGSASFVTAESPKEVQARVESLQVELDNDKQALFKVTNSLGETCLVALTPYRPDGVMHDSDEKDVLSDLLADPAKPCGDTQGTVRQKIRALDKADQSVLADGNYLRSSRIRLDLANRDQNTQKNALEIGALIGASIGVAAGVMISLTETNETLAAC